MPEFMVRCLAWITVRMIFPLILGYRAAILDKHVLDEVDQFLRDRADKNSRTGDGHTAK